SVAQERKWLQIVEAFPKETVQAFVAKNLEERCPTVFAVLGERVVGWADVRVDSCESIRHRGILGMGVHKDFRSRGLGQQLLRRVIDGARTRGLMRIDLTVYATNAAAFALYRKLGFTEEGRIIKGRYLDGRFDDVIFMGLIFGENLPRNH